MFTFRAHQTEPIHSHRLLYLHASQQDHQVVRSARRFKTESDETTTLDGISITNTNSRSRLSLNKTYSSVKKNIQYFDLDLRSLVESTRCNQTTPRKVQKPAMKEVLQCSTEKKQFSDDAFSTLGFNSLSDEKRINGSIECSLASNKSDRSKRKQIRNSDQVNIAQLINKENIDELWHSIPFNQNKRVKQLQKDFKDINLKYNKLKQKSTQPYHSMVRPKHLIKPTSNNGETKQELQVKRIEKVLADSKGNEYRVTIERV